MSLKRRHCLKEPFGDVFQLTPACAPRAGAIPRCLYLYRDSPGIAANERERQRGTTRSVAPIAHLALKRDDRSICDRVSLISAIIDAGILNTRRARARLSLSDGPQKNAPRAELKRDSKDQREGRGGGRKTPSLGNLRVRRINTQRTRLISLLDLSRLDRSS